MNEAELSERQFQ